jgi:hypothetical protein
MNNYKIQSVLINNNIYTLDEATQWIKDNKFKIKQIDITDNYYRFRQLNPQYIERLGYNKYITKKLHPNNNDIELIIAYK